MKILIAIVICLSLATPCYAAVDKDTLYQQFGPQMFDAMMNVLETEINSIRQELNLPQRPKDKLAEDLEKELQKIKPYKWMKAK